MAFALSCSCGAAFEVEDTLAGQEIGCPECQQPIPVPALVRTGPRTSGLALASLVIALILGFTGLGILAVPLGMAGLVSIARNRGRLAGTGYAIGGIVTGLIFTGLTALAASNWELFALDDRLRETVMGGQVDRTGPLEIIRAEDGFAISRPSNRWGVRPPGSKTDDDVDAKVMLIHPAKDTYVDVLVEDLFFRTLDQYKEDVLKSFREQPDAKKEPGLRIRGLNVLQDRRLPTQQGAEVIELSLHARVSGQPIQYLIRIIHPPGKGQVYLVRGWTHRSRYARMEAEVRQALDSFRLLKER